MRACLALVWKEWREVRWFLIAGLGVFVAFPLIEATFHYCRGYGFRSDMGNAIAPAFGGVFAIFVAVGLTCQDLRDKLTVFWQSRPISIWWWITAKYITGLVVVMVVCSTPLIMQIQMSKAYYPNRGLDSLYSFLSCHTFTLILIYSLSFVVGCLVRKATYAAIFSIGITLLVYFLPLLVPPLAWFSIFNLMEQWPVKIVRLSTLGPGGSWFGEKLRIIQIPGVADYGLRYNVEWLQYIIVVFVCSVAGIIFSGMAIKRNWRLKMEQKFMFWSLGVIVLLLLFTLAFQIGSNMTCLQRINLPTKGFGSVYNITVEGDQGVVLFSDGPFKGSGEDKKYIVSKLDLSKPDVIIAPGVTVAATGSPGEIRYYMRTVVWSAKNSSYVYFLLQKMEKEERWKQTGLSLCVASLNTSLKDPIINRIDVLPYKLSSPIYDVPKIHLYKEKIYVYDGNKLLVIDVDTPDKPKVSKELQERFGFAGETGGSGRSTLNLRLISSENLSFEERLNLTLEIYGDRPYVMASDGNKLIAACSDFIRVYEFTKLNGDIAEFEQISQRYPKPLERYLHWYPRHMVMRDGLAYVLNLRNSMTAFDVSRSGQIEKVGHFASPGGELAGIAPLTGGNILVGGSKLHIVAPPKLSKNK